MSDYPAFQSRLIEDLRGQLATAERERDEAEGAFDLFRDKLMRVVKERDALKAQLAACRELEEAARAMMGNSAFIVICRGMKTVLHDQPQDGDQLNRLFDAVDALAKLEEVRDAACPD